MNEARRQPCDRPVIGRTDASVRRFKGWDRPMQDQPALTDPIELIGRGKPKVLDKGTTYRGAAASIHQAVSHSSGARLHAAIIIQSCGAA